MEQYSYREMMAISAGRLINNGDILFAGTGLSLLAAAAAKKLYAPKAIVFFETGGVDPCFDELPMAVADGRIMYGTALNSGLVDAFSILGHRKLHTIAFLGAAQIDRFGNLNSTCIGNYRRPTIRFPGSGGACDAASLASSVIVFIELGREKFVEKLDYLTSPGWLIGGNSRRLAGYKRGGPIAVVTDRGIMRFDPDTKEMFLSEFYPAVAISSILDNMSFSVDISRAMESLPPSADELRTLREEIDPHRLILS